MEATRLFKYAVAITYGVFVGKILGLLTEGAVLELTKGLRSTKDESETE